MAGGDITRGAINIWTYGHLPEASSPALRCKGGPCWRHDVSPSCQIHASMVQSCFDGTGVDKTMLSIHTVSSNVYLLLQCTVHLLPLCMARTVFVKTVFMH